MKRGSFDINQIRLNLHAINELAVGGRDEQARGKGLNSAL